jgi:hypothetical protein
MDNLETLFYKRKRHYKASGDLSLEDSSTEQWSKLRPQRYCRLPVGILMVNVVLKK